MSTIEESIEVDVPVSTAYNQWTQFESFPQFMDGVDSITQIDDTRNRWVVTVGGQTREVETEITEQHPDERIAWRSVTGDTRHAGVVTFHRISDQQTRVMIQMDWEPEDAAEKAGAAVGADARQIKADAKRFKEFIESRGVETGGWRGDVDQP